MKKNYILAADFETTTVDKTKYQDQESYNLAVKNFNPEVYSWVLSMKKENEEFPKGDSRNYDLDFGINLDSFMNTVLSYNDTKGIKGDIFTYFHNGGKFDFHYILYWLVNNGYTQIMVESKNEVISSNINYDDSNILMIEKGRLLEPGEFTVLIDGSRKIMEIKVATYSYKRTKGKKTYRAMIFRDSNLLSPGSIKGYGASLNKQYQTKAFTKLDIDYNRTQPYNSIEELINDGQELKYLLRDGIILSEYLDSFSKILPFHRWKMTAASTAMFNFKRILREQWLEIEIKKQGWKKGERYLECYNKKGQKVNVDRKFKTFYNKMFPTDWLDEVLDNGETMGNFYQKKIIRGGLTQANPIYAGKIVENVRYVDINSSYPSVMKSEKFPVGQPLTEESLKNYKGETISIYKVNINKVYNSKGIPFIGTKVNGSYQYTKIIENQQVFLTEPELIRFKKYYVGEYSYETFQTFQSIDGKKLFGEYIDLWMELKEEGAREGNLVKKIVAKLFLNSLYGKFGEKSEREMRAYQLIDNEFVWTKEEFITPQKHYVPIAAFILAYAKLKLVDAVGKNVKYFVYCDTDSISFMIPKESNDSFLVKTLGIDLHPTKLGAWDIEYKINWMITRRAKQYLFNYDDNITSITFAGLRLNKKQLAQVSQEDFVNGISGFTHLRPHRAITGIVLEEYEKQINPIWKYKLNPDSWFQNEQDFHKGALETLNFEKV